MIIASKTRTLVDVRPEPVDIVGRGSGDVLVRLLFSTSTDPFIQYKMSV